MTLPVICIGCGAEIRRQRVIAFRPSVDRIGGVCTPCREQTDADVARVESYLGLRDTPERG